MDGGGAHRGEDAEGLLPLPACRGPTRGGREVARPPRRPGRAAARAAPTCHAARTGTPTCRHHHEGMDRSAGRAERARSRTGPRPSLDSGTPRIGSREDQKQAPRKARSPGAPRPESPDRNSRPGCGNARDLTGSGAALGSESSGRLCSACRARPETSPGPCFLASQGCGRRRRASFAACDRLSFEYCTGRQPHGCWI